MAIKILMPKMSDTMTEGVIAVWHKKVGDIIKSGDVLAEIETDKATMEYEEIEEGVLLYQVPEKSTVTVDDLIAIIGKAGESYEDLLNGGASQAVKVETKTENTSAVKLESVVETAVLEAPVSNAVAVTMPKMSDTMTEGVIANWLKKVGDTVKTGEVLAEIETDKATMEYESFDAGTLLYVAAEKGQSVLVDDLLCVIGEANADYKAVIRQFEQSKGKTATDNTETKPATTTETPVAETQTQSNEAIEHQNGANTNGRVKISPLAKKIATEKGFNLTQIKGSGDGGRIIKKDVENFVPAAQPKQTEKVSTTTVSSTAPTIGQESFEEVPTSQMRKTIARRLAESKFTAPHFYLTMEIHMDEAMKAREQMNQTAPVKLSFNDMVVKASAMALRKHPAVNSSWLGDKIRYNHHIHVGVAVAVDEGLLVPVIRFADSKSLAQISAETKDLAKKAKEKKLQPADWAGNTFSVSNLGMFGIDEFTAIINPPDACIMAIGSIKETALVKNGQIVIGNVMKVTLSCDHRVVDGASGAAFLQTFKELMEAPVRMLI